MVDLVLLQSLSYVAAAIGVCVAAIYYVMTLRAQQKTMKDTLETRQADILQRHAQINISQEFMDAWHDVFWNQNFLTYKEWQDKYGPDVNPDAWTNLASVIQYYEILGGLLREKIVSIELIETIWQPLHIYLIWERVEPVIKGWREDYHADSLYNNFEYLFNRYNECHPESSLTLSVIRKDYLRMHPR